MVVDTRVNHTRTFKQFPPICKYLSNDDTKVIHQDRIFLVADTRVNHTRTFKQFPPICKYLSNDDTKVIHQDRIFLVANTRVYQSRIEIVLLEHLNINAKSDKDCFMFMDLYISIIVSKLEKIVNFHYNNHFTWLRFSCTSDTRFIYQSGICISLLEYRKSLNKKIQK